MAPNPPSPELARLLRVFGVRLAVAGAVLCVADAPLLGLATLTLAGWLFTRGSAGGATPARPD